MLGIRDILVRIRIRILGSVPLTNRLNADPGIPKTYGSYRSGSRSRGGFGTRVIHLHHSSKIKSLKKLQNSTVEIKVFLTNFAWWWKNPDPGPDPYFWLTNTDADPGGPKTSGSECGSRCPTLEITVSSPAAWLLFCYFCIRKQCGPDALDVGMLRVMFLPRSTVTTVADLINKIK